jgi:hypothetical protein
MCGKFFAAATSGCTAGEYVCVSSTRTRTGSISQDQDARLRAEKRMEVPAGSSGGGYFLPATTKFAIMQLTSRKREKILSLSVCDDDVFTRKRLFYSFSHGLDRGIFFLNDIFCSQTNCVLLFSQKLPSTHS